MKDICENYVNRKRIAEARRQEKAIMKSIEQAIKDGNCKISQKGDKIHFEFPTNLVCRRPQRSFVVEMTKEQKKWEEA